MATTTSQYPLHAGSSNGSSGSPSAQQQQPQGAPQHKRVYQACIPCRRRKVKCDMGSVDNPHDPPCVRCRRESKECFFSATRRKRKHEDGGPDSLDGYEYDDYTVRNGRKMAHTSPPPSVRQSSMGAPSSARSAAQYGDIAPVASGPPLTPGGSIGRPQPLRRPNQSSRENSNRIDGRHSEESNTQLENLEAQEVMRREVYGPHDALDLLYKAATDRCVPFTLAERLTDTFLSVLVTREVTAKCHQLWAIIQIFIHTWHPLCKTMELPSRITICVLQKFAERHKLIPR